MKKTVMMIIAAALVVGMSGCSVINKNTDDVSSQLQSSRETENVETVSESESVTDTTAAKVTSAEAETVPGTTYVLTSSAVVTEPVAEDGLSVYTESFVNGECSVTLVYPRFGDGEHDLFDISMHNFAMQKYNQSGMMPEDSAVYEVTMCDVKYESECFVSAVVAGHIINSTAAHDSYFSYTVNADPRNGRIYLSEELIGELDLLKGAFLDGRFEQKFGMQGLLSEISPEDITQSWRSDYGVFPNMYFTDDSFGILAEVPYVVGGYAGFEIPYAETGEMINPVARGLCGIIVATD